MTKSTEEVVTTTESPITLTEFCQSLSLTDKRVEMLGAFFAAQKRLGNMKNTNSAYLKLFNDFANAPA